MDFTKTTCLSCRHRDPLDDSCGAGMRTPEVTIDIRTCTCSKHERRPTAACSNCVDLDHEILACGRGRSKPSRVCLLHTRAETVRPIRVLQRYMRHSTGTGDLS